MICNICRKSIETEKISLYKCQHSYHPDCLIKLNENFNDRIECVNCYIDKICL